MLDLLGQVHLVLDPTTLQQFAMQQCASDRAGGGVSEDVQESRVSSSNASSSSLSRLRQPMGSPVPRIGTAISDRVDSRPTT
jgi:hypothetical protein